MCFWYPYTTITKLISMKKLKDLYIAYRLRKEVNMLIWLYKAGMDAEAKQYLALLSIIKESNNIVKLLTK